MAVPQTLQIPPAAVGDQHLTSQCFRLRALHSWAPGHSNRLEAPSPSQPPLTNHKVWILTIKCPLVLLPSPFPQFLLLGPGHSHLPRARCHSLLTNLLPLLWPPWVPALLQARAAFLRCKSNLDTWVASPRSWDTDPNTQHPQRLWSIRADGERKQRVLRAAFQVGRRGRDLVPKWRGWTSPVRERGQTVWWSRWQWIPELVKGG